MPPFSTGSTYSPLFTPLCLLENNKKTRTNFPQPAIYPCPFILENLNLACFVLVFVKLLLLTTAPPVPASPPPPPPEAEWKLLWLLGIKQQVPQQPQASIKASFPRILQVKLLTAPDDFSSFLIFFQGDLSFFCLKDPFLAATSTSVFNLFKSHLNVKYVVNMLLLIPVRASNFVQDSLSKTGIRPSLT